jgi:hypothetical protein
LADRVSCSLRGDGGGDGFGVGSGASSPHAIVNTATAIASLTGIA